MKNPIAPWDFRKSGNKSNSSNSSKIQSKKTSIVQSAASGTCGARTKKGTPCKRKVAGGGYCWQHK